MCEDGTPRWHLSTRDGWQVNGMADGATLMLKASHFEGRDENHFVRADHYRRSIVIRDHFSEVP